MKQTILCEIYFERCFCCDYYGFRLLILDFFFDICSFTCFTPFKQKHDKIINAFNFRTTGCHKIWSPTRCLKKSPPTGFPGPWSSLVKFAIKLKENLVFLPRPLLVSFTFLYNFKYKLVCVHICLYFLWKFWEIAKTYSQNIFCFELFLGA